MNGLLGLLLLATSIFLILLILIQRGRGGGLAGAFGGMGGQSAFGTKAGDLFTRVTIGVTFLWIVLCIVGVKVMGSNANHFSGGPNGPGTEQNSGPELPSSRASSGGAPTGAGTEKSDATDKGAAAGTGATEGAPAGTVPGNENKGSGAPASGVDNSTGGTAPVAPPAASDSSKASK
ncbi:MAG TPA: preprotein translocase subunit SecG [Pirellulales bacterium]|nr:preprotein translocase subunit SecG [Pirellulales bacterium]